MQKYVPFIKAAITALEEKDLLKSLERAKNFHDEPKPFHYVAYAGDYSNYFKIIVHDFVSNGISFTSKQVALSKCLGEHMERFCQIYLSQKPVIFSSFSELTSALDPSKYGNSDYDRKTLLGWIKGHNVTRGEASYIPMQLVYLNNENKEKEPYLAEPVTTGAAGGFDYESTVLSGIYEVVERDSFMTLYLNKIPTPRIQIDSMKNSIVKGINNKLQRYNLEPFLYDITNDLSIPSFMTILIDRSGVGPAATFGLKSNLNSMDAIIGCIEEAVMARFWTRNEMRLINTHHRKIDPRVLSGAERGVYWSSLDMLRNIDFLTKQNPVEYKGTDYKNKDKGKELSEVKELLRKKGYEIYAADITRDFVRDIGYQVHKIIIPGLQPLYLHEEHKDLKMDRLETVARHFSHKKYAVNKIPHPFT